MRAVALVLALIPPLPVTTVDALPNIDGSVTIFWTFPPDPSIVGVTVFRDRLDVGEPVVEFTLGLDSSLTDFSTVITGSYRYRVHTRSAFGELSVGTFVEVFGTAEPIVFVDEDDDVDSWFVCWASVAPGPSLWSLGLAAFLISSLVALRRVRWSRRLRNRLP